MAAACAAGHADCVQLLLERNVSVNPSKVLALVTNKSSPLHEAVINGIQFFLPALTSSFCRGDRKFFFVNDFFFILNFKLYFEMLKLYSMFSFVVRNTFDILLRLSELIRISGCGMMGDNR